MRLPGGAERGQAVIETIMVGLLLLVPVVWVLGVLADLHRSALAATAGAREAGFEAARSTSAAGADAAVAGAVRRAFVDHGLDPNEVRVRWTAGQGLERGGAVEVELSYPVTVVQAPFLGRTSGPSIWVRARHITRIDPFRSRE